MNTWMPGFGPEPATDDARKDPLDLELPSGAAQL
jgi:hypothetical protein